MGELIWRFISAGVLVLVVGGGQPQAGHAALAQFFAPTVVVSSAQSSASNGTSPSSTLPKSDGQLAVRGDATRRPAGCSGGMDRRSPN